MRKKQANKRIVLPDPVYNSRLVTKAINKIMWNGAKGNAQKILYNAFKMIEEKSDKPALEVFEEAISNVSPFLELRSRRIGGANYRIPIETNEDRRITLALRWIISFARNRSEKTMIERIAYEIMAAAKNTGSSVKKKEETHKMAEANRAFAHYRW